MLWGAVQGSMQGRPTELESTEPRVSWGSHSASPDLGFHKMKVRTAVCGESRTCCSRQGLNKRELPSSLPCFIKSSGPYIWLFLFTNCRQKFKITSWGKGKGTGLAHWWSSARRMYRALDMTSVCVRYSSDFKTYSSVRQVLRTVCFPGRVAPVWYKRWLLRTNAWCK